MSCTVLRCHQCGTFQVHQQKKAKKWTCKMCNEKQSFVKVYADGSGAECRSVVQTLNLCRQEVDQLDVRVARQPGAGRVDGVSNLHTHTTALTSDLGQQRGHNSMQATAQKKSKWSPFVEREESEEADSDTDEEKCGTVDNTKPAAQRRHPTPPPRSLSLSAAQRGNPIHKKSSGFFHSARDRKPAGWTSHQTHSGENHALYGSALGLPLWKPTIVPSRDVAIVPSREVAIVPSREVANVPRREVAIVPSREVAIVPSRAVAIMSSREVANVPSREVAIVPSREVANVPSREVANVPSREVANVPSREVANVPSREVAIVPSREVANVPNKEVAIVPSREVAIVPSREVANVPSREVAIVPSREVANVPSKEVAIVPSREVANVPSREVAKVPSKEVAKVPSREVAKVPSKEVAGGGAFPDCTSFIPHSRQEGSYPADGFQCRRMIATPPVQHSTGWGAHSPTERVTRRHQHSAHTKVSDGSKVSTGSNVSVGSKVSAGSKVSTGSKVSAGSSNTSKWSQYLEAEEQSEDEDTE